MRYDEIIFLIYELICPLTKTGPATLVSLVACVADTAVASSQILTYSIRADIRIQCTLINVCGWNSSCQITFKDFHNPSRWTGRTKPIHTVQFYKLEQWGLPVPSTENPIPLWHKALNSARKQRKKIKCWSSVNWIHRDQEIGPWLLLRYKS